MKIFRAHVGEGLARGISTQTYVDAQFFFLLLVNLCSLDSGEVVYLGKAYIFVKPQA